MIQRSLMLLVAAVLLAGCTGESSPDAASAPDPTTGAASASKVDLPEFSGLAEAGIEIDRFNEGLNVYTRYCTPCHTYGPPPKIAPPMLGISQHYHEAFDSAEAGIAHMVAYIKDPNPEESVLMSIAHERWGTMPALPLPEEDLQAVMYWTWSLYDLEVAEHGGH